MSFVVIFFFFKQKTAYEMRISDWSSDVCSSDLDGGAEQVNGAREALLLLLGGDPAAQQGTVAVARARDCESGPNVAGQRQLPVGAAIVLVLGDAAQDRKGVG